MSPAEHMMGAVETASLASSTRSYRTYCSGESAAPPTATATLTAEVAPLFVAMILSVALDEAGTV